MGFRNQEGRNVTISLVDPKENLTSAEVQAAMDLVIGKNVISSSGGDLVEKREIKVINNTTDDLYMPLT